MAAERVILHIGTHRTGTTSIQRFLHDHREALHEASGVGYPEGAVLPECHLELALACMRPSRLRDVAPFTNWMLERLDAPLRSAIDERWWELVRERFVADPARSLVYSAEGLSWLRHPDEIARLRSLFREAALYVVVFFRRPDDFLASYRWMASFMTNDEEPRHDSVWYAEPDSWLVDYGQRLRLWRDEVGAERVTALDYDACRRSFGSTVAAFVDVVGLESGPDTWEYFLNGRLV